MQPQSNTSFWDQPFWGRGFRPFFLMGAIYTVLSIGLWAGFYGGVFSPPSFLMDPVSWHAHEMIYGFAVAIIAGFLLTAVANWTGGAPARQCHLAALCGLWLSGRVVLNLDMGLPHPAVVGIAVSFLPALALSLAVPLLRSWNKRNFVFLTLLAILFGCDVWFLTTWDLTALHVALMTILSMISLIGGRVIPAFTVAALRREGMNVHQTDQATMDMAALVSLAAVALCLVFAKDTPVLALCAAVSCGVHALRMRRYHTLKTGSDPLLWILQAGYGWLVVGLGLLALTGLGVLTLPAVIHALTAGCIGSMVLGMICRVTLGHTGRELTVGGATCASFTLIQIAAAMRVFGPMIAPDYMTQWIIGSAGLWAVCYASYLWVYAPMLFAARPDGAQA